MAAARTEPAQVPLNEPDLSLEDFLPYRLNMLAGLISQGFAHLCSDHFGISIPEWRVVAMLGQHGRQTSKAIGERSGMHKTMVSRAVGDLERRRLVERELNLADKREVFVTLTTTGRGIYDSIIPLAGEYSERMTVDLTPDDRAEFDRIIGLLRARARQVFGLDEVD